MTCWERKPWVMWWVEVHFFDAFGGVLAPRDLEPLRREAAIWVGERGMGFGWLWVRESFEDIVLGLCQVLGRRENL